MTMHTIIKLPTLNSRPLEWQELWDAIAAHPEMWIPTTEHMNDEMLGAVPPVRMASGAFLVGEAAGEDEQGRAFYTCFAGPVSRRYYARNMTCEEFDGLTGITK
jgi:hypothetical protein